MNSLDPDGQEPVAKLCDFGDCRITGPNMTPKVGTLSYMAPEVLNCEPYSNKVDVYSYGMLLWEIITRKEPYLEDNFMYEVKYYFSTFVFDLISLSWIDTKKFFDFPSTLSHFTCFFC